MFNSMDEVIRVFLEKRPITFNSEHVRRLVAVMSESMDVLQKGCLILQQIDPTGNINQQFQVLQKHFQNCVANVEKDTQI